MHLIGDTVVHERFMGQISDIEAKRENIKLDTQPMHASITNLHADQEKKETDAVDAINEMLEARLMQI